MLFILYVAYIFQDDDAPPHRSRMVMELKQSLQNDSLPWTSQSSVRNPIEHVWNAINNLSDPFGRMTHCSEGLSLENGGGYINDILRDMCLSDSHFV